ncbi:MAG: carboxypeptidase regulatory-like domain-containing protein, partial [Bacteroidota bacterium]
GVFFSSCEKDDMNEEELMEKIQETDFNISVYDRTDMPIGGAQVKLTNNGEVLTAETDSSGVASFTDVSVGEAKLIITQEGYFEYDEQITVETSGREASANHTAFLYSEDEAARIAGNVKLQTDLTTDSAEHPEGVTITAFDDNDTPIAKTKTKANGDFELLIPTDASGRYVWIKFPDLEYDQTIAVRENDTVVKKTAVGTVFKPYPKYGETDKVESTSNIKAEIDPPNNLDETSYSRQAYIKSLTVESGLVTDVEIGYPGRGYADWGTHDIYITSGTLPEANITVEGTNDTNPYYYPLNPGTVQINDPGANYPEHEPNQNVYTQPPKGFIWDDGAWFKWARLNNTELVTAGDIYRIDANYGTGTDRGNIQ